MSQSESFLRRWSRLKIQARVEAGAQPEVAAQAPLLPKLDEVEFSSDFSAFMHPDVDSKTRLQALRKLFMNDHYRVMDGLDVYVEDFSRPIPLSPELLQTLEHAQSLLVAREEEGAAMPSQQRSESP